VIPPTRNGVTASCIALPSRQPAACSTVLDFLVERFAAIPRDEWLARMDAGEVCNDAGERVSAQSRFIPQQKIYYFRRVAHEPHIPFAEQIVFQDAHIVVADKPHFLPVTPAGRFVEETLLVRLKRKLGVENLSPAHRIDRDTAGLVLFTIQPATRDVYQRLFRERAVEKRYEATEAALAKVPASCKCTKLMACRTRRRAST
jgi:tRNA pseudouridine32 synthase/23S rRNA pseudouridine746 synthase